MNILLDVAGHFLYLLLSIVLLPVFITLDVVLGAWIAAKAINKLVRKLYTRYRRSKDPLQLVPSRKRLAEWRTKWAGVHLHQ